MNFIIYNKPLYGHEMQNLSFTQDILDVIFIKLAILYSDWWT